MNKEKKIWLCEQYAQKAWTLYLNLTQEAAKTGDRDWKNRWSGYAIIANESRTLSNVLFDYAAKVRFEDNDDNIFNGIADIAVMAGFLAVNASIEFLHTENDKDSIKILMAYAEELRLMALGLSEINVNKDWTKVWAKPFTIPEIISPLKSTEANDFFFQYSVGGVSLIENMSVIKEVNYPAKSDIANGIFNLRGIKTKVIDLYKRFNLSGINHDRQTVMIICPDRNNYTGIYAVPIDDLDVNAIFKSRIGYNAPPKESHIFAKYSRECWDVIGGDQIMFADWQKLI